MVLILLACLSYFKNSAQCKSGAARIAAVIILSADDFWVHGVYHAASETAYRKAYFKTHTQDIFCA